MSCGGHIGQIVLYPAEFAFYLSGLNDFVLAALRIFTGSRNNLQGGTFELGCTIDLDRLTTSGSDLVSQIGTRRQVQITFHSRCAKRCIDGEQPTHLKISHRAFTGETAAILDIHIALDAAEVGQRSTAVDQNTFMEIAFGAQRPVALGDE